MNKKRVNHLTPSSYLKNFCDDKGFLWVYAEQNQYNPYHLKPENAARAKEYYGKFEDYLAQNYESPFIPLINQYIKFGKLAKDKKHGFALLVSHMFSRYVFVEYLKKEIGKSGAVEHALDEKIIENRAQKILSMDWELVRAPIGKYFITCDLPVLSHIPNPGGDIPPEEVFEIPRTTISFPLSQNVCWIARYNNWNFKDLNELIKHLNRQRIKCCYKEIYAPVEDTDLIKLLYYELGAIKPFRNLYDIIL